MTVTYGVINKMWPQLVRMFHKRVATYQHPYHQEQKMFIYVYQKNLTIKVNIIISKYQLSK